jgi:Zn-dependent peptidase ImmA (M78 family)
VVAVGNIESAQRDNARRDNARRAAQALIQRFGVQAAEHIVVEGFAARLGIKITMVPLKGATAQLLAPEDGPAEILLSDRLHEVAARRFTIAHELGHYVLKHPSPSVAEMCEPMARGHERHEARDVEAEANAFASELLMPEHLVRPACEAAWVSLDPALRIAYEFGVSARASAIRFVELTAMPCAVVLSERGAVRWSVTSATFPGAIARGRPVDRRSIAWDYFKRGVLRHGMQLVPGAAWLDSATDGPLLEHSIASYERGTVLTMLGLPRGSLRAPLHRSRP